MGEIISYIIIFILLFTVYYFLILNSPKKLDKYKKSTEILYLTKKYKIKLNDFNFKKMATSVVLINSFIITTIVMIVSYVDNLIYKTILSTLIIIPIILIVYHLLGKYYQKRGIK